MGTLRFQPATPADPDLIMAMEASGFAAVKRENRQVYGVASGEVWPGFIDQRNTL